MSDFQKLRNKFVITAAATSIIGAVCWVAPNSFLKGLGNFLGCAGVGGIVVSQLVTDESERISDTAKQSEHVKTNELKFDLDKARNTIDKVVKESEKYKTGLQEYRELCAKQQEDLKTYSNQISLNNLSSQQLQKDFEQLIKTDSHGVVDALNQSLAIFKVEIEGLIKNTLHHYPELAEKLQNLEDKVGIKLGEFTNLIDAVGSYETFKDITLGAIAVQHEIIYHLSVIKAHIFQSQNRVLKLILKDCVTLQEHEEVVDNVNALWFQKYDNLQGNIESIRQEFSTTADQVIEAYNTDYKEMVGEGLSGVEKMDALQREILRLQQIIQELQKPIEWRSNILDAQKVGNLIIRYLWGKGIRLDRAFINNDPYEPILYFNTNRLDDVVKIDEINKFSEAIQQHVDLLLEPPHFTYNGEYGLLQTKIKLATKPKPNKDDLVAKIPDCKSLVVKSKRGFLITGHPGSGKTSAMKAIAQWMGDENSMRLALNPHTDDMSSFEDSGFVEINDLDDIYDAIAQLDIELKMRGEDKTRRKMLIIAVDELGRILKDEPKELDVMEVLRQTAVEGRKFNVIVLIGNHSQTTTAIDMDSQFRDSFYQLFLVGAAVSRINMPNSPALKEYEEQWIRSSDYPVLIGINGKFQASQHPTHSIYNIYQDSGNPPIGLVEMKPNAVFIGKKTYISSNNAVGLTPQEKDLIDQNKHLVNMKTSAGLSRLIEVVKGVKASKSDEYKRTKDMILEYLKELP